MPLGVEDDTPQTQQLNSLDEVVRAAKTLREEGWEVLPCDFPLEGGVGIVAWKTDLASSYRIGDNTRHLVFYPLGKMTPEIEHLHNSIEFLKILTSEGYYQCDDPKSLLLGAIKYNTERRVALVKYIRISDLKNTADKLSSAARAKLSTSEGQRPRPFTAELESIQEGLVA